jgi:hypothetical protein
VRPPCCPKGPSCAHSLMCGGHNVCLHLNACFVCSCLSQKGRVYTHADLSAAQRQRGKTRGERAGCERSSLITDVEADHSHLLCPLHQRGTVATPDHITPSFLARVVLVGKQAEPPPAAPSVGEFVWLLRRVNMSVVKMC